MCLKKKERVRAGGTFESQTVRVCLWVHDNLGGTEIL